MLPRRLPATFRPRLSKDAVNTAKQLLSKDRELEVPQLCGLLHTLEGRSDSLWPSVRTQLLTNAQKKTREFSSPEALEVMNFIRRTGGREAEHELFRGASLQLKKNLNNKAEPRMVALVARHLEDIVDDFGTVQILLNAAVRLRKDLYPAVLWTLFVRCADVGLVKKHPATLVRLQRVGEVLEEYGIKRHKMALRDMSGVVKAMKENGVILHKCLKQMAKLFIDVHAEVLKVEPVGDSLTKDGVADDDALVNSSDDSEKVPKSRQTPPLTSRVELGEANWLEEVQKLMLEFWLQLVSVGVDDEGLSTILSSFCQPQGQCAIPRHLLAHCISQLNFLLDRPSSETDIGESASVCLAQDLADGLAKLLAEQLADLKQRELVEVAQIASTPAGGACGGMLWCKIFDEVNRRLSQGGRTRLSVLRRVEDFDDVVSMLGAIQPIFRQRDLMSGSAPISVDVVAEASELSHKIGQLMVESLPSLLAQESENSFSRLAVFVRHLSAFGLALRTTALQSARIWLHKVELSAQATPMPQESFVIASDLAFSFAALSGGQLSLDVAGRLNRVLGGVLGAIPYVSGGVGNRMEEAAALLSRRQAAQLWVFFIASHHFLSRSAIRTLHLAPEAPTLTALLAQFQRKDRAATSSPCFDLQDESGARGMVLLLQDLIAKTSLVKEGQDCRERFEVPGTPYRVDFAWPASKHLVIVPRTEHLSTQTSEDGIPCLNASALLAQRILESHGWKICWAWTHIWAKRCEDGTPSEVIADMFASSVQAIGE